MTTRVLTAAKFQITSDIARDTRMQPCDSR